ncbi:hypothetical protein ITX31_05895 [Arthrobacter gandavensis]|uniref:hypothetical protein n=1 Tax=Arthrobacter gandavensis TaxID=169960 RepID=UPI0018907D7A|nr:hypothetical protein [Arthrobacter gandavensis]MBF4993640.1 hypothetical protein [Arthrobacter gandavensis]
MPTGRTDSMVPGADRRDSNEDGSAAVEFVFLGVLLLVPLVYLILTAGQVQGAAYAMVGAAEHAAKVYAASSPEDGPDGQARAAAELALADFGFDPGVLELQITCSPECGVPGSTVSVTAAMNVPLPFAGVLGMDLAPVRVDSTAMQTVERYR